MKNLDIDFISEDKRIALLFGILLGDGCLSCYSCKDRKNKRKTIVITGHKKDDREFFEKILVPLLKSLTNSSIKIKERKIKQVIEIHVSDKLFFTKISSLGFPIGKKGASLKIPKIFYDKDLVMEITRGFFATDGSLVITKNPNKYYPRVEGNGISKNLIGQIFNYLIKVGMKGYLYEAKRKTINPKWNVIQKQYRFQFNGLNNLLLFNNLIGFINPKHNKRYVKFLKYSEKYDKAIFKISSKQQKSIGEKINTFFYK